VTGDLDALVSLYHEDAIYVTGRHSAQGPTGIRAQFSELLDMLPEAQFHQEELRRDGSIRFLHWSATSAGSQVRRGRDTIGVRAGKIQYHSSSYRLVTNQENPAARDDSTSNTTHRSSDILRGCRITHEAPPPLQFRCCKKESWQGWKSTLSDQEERHIDAGGGGMVKHAVRSNGAPRPW
jgi:hypothetical protein